MALSALPKGARVAPRAFRKAASKPVSKVVARAEPAETSSAAPEAAKVYFGGKEYTEAEVRQLRARGRSVCR